MEIEKELSRLQALVDDATDGPWSSFISDNKDMILAGDGAILIGYFWESSRHINQLEDKDHKFIAESRTAMPKLIRALRVALDALSCYSQGRRDQSFKGWEKEWRYIKPKHESDYEFYPNHDAAVDGLEEINAILSGGSDET